jgi:hypothetical protein
VPPYRTELGLQVKDDMVIGYIYYGFLGVLSLAAYFAIARKLGHRVVSALIAALIPALIPQIYYFFQHGYLSKFFLVGFVFIFIPCFCLNLIVRFIVYLEQRT